MKKEEIHEKVEQAKQMMNNEDIKPEMPPKITLTVKEFSDKLVELNQLGRSATMQHREEQPMSHNGKKNKRKGFHPPGTEYEKCALCKKIIDAHNDFMQLQSQAFGITGIPFDGLMASIKITEGILRLRENEK